MRTVTRQAVILVVGSTFWLAAFLIVEVGFGINVPMWAWGLFSFACGFITILTVRRLAR